MCSLIFSLRYCYLFLDIQKRIPLGMQSGFIRTNQITANSSYNNLSNYRPGQARFGLKVHWCGNQIGKVKAERDYHQVDFGKPVILTGIATQGDYDHAPNFVKKFYLETGITLTEFSAIHDCPSPSNKKVS